MNEITRYHNDLNSFSTRKWTAEEMDFFFAIITKAKDKGARLLEFDKEELSAVAGYKGNGNVRLKTRLKQLAEHVGSLRYIEETAHSIDYMNLFQRFKIVWNEDETDFKAYVRVSEDFEYVLNQINANFTTFEFSEFARLRGTYAKTLYRLLKQYRQTGQRYFTIEEFKFLLGIPDCYKACHVQEKVIDPCLKELAGVFSSLQVTPKKKKKKRGNPIIGYLFTWDPVTAQKWLEPEEYKKQKAKEEAIKRDEKKAVLPDWYDKVPTKKVSPEKLAQIRKMRAELEALEAEEGIQPKPSKRYKKPKESLPDWYDNIPTEKSTEEDVKEVLELQRQIFGGTDE